MAEIAQLITLLQRQLETQSAAHKLEMETLCNAQQQQISALADRLASTTSPSVSASIPKFSSFDSTSELWKDYRARFLTFVGANSIPKEKEAKVFLTNQSTVNYKLLGTLAAQQSPPIDVNNLTLDEIDKFMEEQFDPRRFIVRERFKFWSDMGRKPGETIQELAARIRQDAATCDFSSIKKPQDEAMRTRFMCSISNEAVLKALFKVPDNELTFSKAIQIALETEDAAKVAKETVHGSKSDSVMKINQKKNTVKESKGSASTKPVNEIFKGNCIRCGKSGHRPKDCYFKNSKCHFCQKIGHIEAACLVKKSRKEKTVPGQCVSHIRDKSYRRVKTVHSDALTVTLHIKEKQFTFEVDTGSRDSFCSTAIWESLGKPELKPAYRCYYSASENRLPVKGYFSVNGQCNTSEATVIYYNVIELENFNVLGRKNIRRLDIDVNALLKACENSEINQVKTEIGTEVLELQRACKGLCNEFSEIFKPELGCLKDLELEVAFKSDATPIFCKPRTVPFAIVDDLNQAIEVGIKRGIWEPTQFCEYGTLVVPVRKASMPGKKSKLRVCGDYSVTANQQLEIHRHPMPNPEYLMQKLSGGFCFTKIDLADAYNQIKLRPESQRKLALSTHRGVLLQKRMPFGIISAPGYFQEIMEQLTSDLEGVAVFLDDILVSGSSAKAHEDNLRALLKRLQEKGLRCKLEKCSFAQPSVEYLGYTLSSEGIAKGHKVEAILKMPPPINVSEIRSFLGSVQFYGKWIPNMSTLAAPLNLLLKKDSPWKWGAEQQRAFQKLKEVLSSDLILAHFDPSVPIGVSCDASEVGIGAVLFHRYPDGTERPIAHASKTLTETQKRYNPIQREALAIIFGLKKFHHFLYGRKFIVITDHKPLMSVFSPTKGTPTLAANRLARWALTLNQYDYCIEYRKTADHGNADVLSRLPVGEDKTFDREEDYQDFNMVCTVKLVSRQLNPTDPGLMAKESSKDPIISTVMRYTKEGWPQDSSEETKHYKKNESSLSVDSGCLFLGSRIVIPDRLRDEVLKLLHLGHFGMQRMKQLARTVVYWPHINEDIEKLCRSCISCAEHQNKPPKVANHPWMLPEKPWSRLHLDHAINFMGSNWLVLIDAFSKYPCIHPTGSVSTKTTIEILEKDFAHFGNPHTIVTDNAPTFLSEEFQEWCKRRGIAHLTGAPYHPATNGAAERLVQTFKQSLRKSSLPPKSALQEFLMQYRRTPLESGFSPSELLNSRQIRCEIDALVPTPAQIVQSKQSRVSMLQERRSNRKSKAHNFKVGDSCYALYYGPKRNKDPRWVPAVVTKVFGTRSVNVKVYPRGPTWRRHIDQLQPRHVTEEDLEPGDSPILDLQENTKEPRKRRNPRHPTNNEYGPLNPRRSKRLQNKKALNTKTL